jgi:hypothetical protein
MDVYVGSYVQLNVHVRAQEDMYTQDLQPRLTFSDLGRDQKTVSLSLSQFCCAVAV